MVGGSCWYICFYILSIILEKKTQYDNWEIKETEFICIKYYVWKKYIHGK